MAPPSFASETSQAKNNTKLIPKINKNVGSVIAIGSEFYF